MVHHWHVSILGPDVVYTHAQIPGAMQGLLVGAPFFLLAVPEAPFFLINLLSLCSLVYLGWYLSKRIPSTPKWLVYGWLLSAPWVLHYSTMVENPSYVLPAAILFFIGIWEIFPMYDVPLMQRKWAFYWLGFALFWVAQLHLSWVLLLPYIGLAFVFEARSGGRLGKAALFFLLGCGTTALTLAPTICQRGCNLSNGTGSNVAIHPANLLEFFSLCGKYVSFAAAEVVRFTGGTTEERLDFLKNYPWAAPFTLLFAFLGLVQVAYLAVSFFIANALAPWQKARVFTLGSIVLVYCSYLFSKQPPKSHAFYLMLPVMMWYSFYAYAKLYPIKYMRAVFGLLLFSGFVFHLALFQYNSDKYGLAKKRSQVMEAIQQQDYTLLGIRRESARELARWPNLWRRSAEGDRMAFHTDYEYPDPYYKPQNVVSLGAHSGKYSCKVDSILPFGLNFKETFGPGNITQCDAGAYFMGNYTGDVQLVFELKAKGRSVFWESRTIQPAQVGADVWTLLEHRFEFPDTVGSWDEASCYLWATTKNSGVLLVDDATVTFVPADPPLR